MNCSISIRQRNEEVGVAAMESSRGALRQLPVESRKFFLIARLTPDRINGFNCGDLRCGSGANPDARSYNPFQLSQKSMAGK
jgi:hypothetical protein